MTTQKKEDRISKFLSGCDVPYEVIAHRQTFTAQEMAHALHVPGRRVAKTVLLRADHGYRYVVALLPADKNVDMQKVSQLLGGSEIQLASERELAEHCPDCEVGALPPFGSQYGMQTMLDHTLCQEEDLVFEGNSHEEAVRMKLADYRRIETPLVAEIT